VSARGEIELSTAWRKASASNGTSGNCVEAALTTTGNIAVRNSRDPDGPVLLFTPAEWAAFTMGMSMGEFGFLLAPAPGRIEP
jgi:hypothetical protein